jgi:hypothetical protein
VIEKKHVEMHETPYKNLILAEKITIMSEFAERTPDHFINKKKRSVTYTIVFTLVALVGIMWMQNFLFGGISLTGAALFFIVRTSGTELDFKNYRYRDGGFIGNVCFGQWKKLPEIKYISVFKVTMASSVAGLSNTKVHNRQETIKVNLIHGRNKRLTVFQTYDTKEAFSAARTIAQELDLRIYDATSPNRKWLDD